MRTTRSGDSYIAGAGPRTLQPRRPAPLVRLDRAQHTIHRRRAKRPRKHRDERGHRPPAEPKADRREDRAQRQDQQRHRRADHEQRLHPRVLVGFLVRTRAASERRIRPTRRTIQPAPIATRTTASRIATHHAHLPLPSAPPPSSPATPPGTAPKRWTCRAGVRVPARPAACPRVLTACAASQSSSIARVKRRCLPTHRQGKCPSRAASRTHDTRTFNNAAAATQSSGGSDNDTISPSPGIPDSFPRARAGRPPMRGSDCACLTFAPPATTHAPLAQKNPTPVCREPSCDAPAQVIAFGPLWLMTPTPLKRPRNLLTAPTERAGRACTSLQRHPPTGCRRPSRTCICARAGQRGKPAKNLLGAARSRTHLNRQRRQRLHRGAMDRQPARSALVAARTATATLTRHHGLRRGGRCYVHRRRRAALSLLRPRPQTDRAIVGGATIDRLCVHRHPPRWTEP
jgi:hypothetical protein